MAGFDFHRRKTRRWWYTGATLVAVLLFVTFYVGGASANLPGSNFNGGDGNLTCDDTPNPSLDWNCLTAKTTPAINVGVDLASGAGDNSFGGGSKENNSTVNLVSGSIPPQKSDLTRFYEASDIRDVSGAPHVFLYLAWERSNVLGNANMDFEINKTATPCLTDPGPFSGNGVSCTINRSVGDVLITYDFSGSGTPTIGVRTWDGSAWQADTSVTAESAVNTGTVTDSRLSSDLIANTFGEAAVDLTASGVVSAGSCDFGQATTFLKSRSASSFTSEIKDFVSPVTTPLVPCKGAIQVTKLAKNHNCTGAGTASSGTNAASCVAASSQAQAGASFQFWQETNGTAGLQTGAGGDTLAATQSTVLSGSGATAAATTCVPNLTLGTYYVRENTPVSGFAAAADQTATVSAQGDCTSGYVAKTFTDQPLTTLAVTASSVLAGASNSNISCKDSGNNAIGNSPQPPNNNQGQTVYADPVTLNADSGAGHGGALTPGTYTCTIVIDP